MTQPPLDEIPIPAPLLLHPQVRLADLRVFAYVHGAEQIGQPVLTSVDELTLTTDTTAKATRAAILRLRSWGVIDAEHTDEENEPHRIKVEILERPWEPLEYGWRERLLSSYQRRFPGPQEIEQAVEQQVQEQLLTYWCLRNNIQVSPLTGEYRQVMKDGSTGPAVLPPPLEDLNAMYPEVEPLFRQLAREYIDDVYELRPEPRALPW